MLKFLVVVFIGLMMVGGAVVMFGEHKAAPDPVAVAPAEPTAEEKANQEIRLKAIQAEVDAGFFSDVKISRYPTVVVQPPFYRLSFEEKQRMIATVFAYALGEHPNVEILKLHDWQSGKEVGECSKYTGFKME